MKNNTIQKQIGVIGAITMVVSNIIATELHYVDSSVWQTLLLVFAAIALFGVLFGVFSSKMQNATPIFWKISVFFMSLGISWMAIALLRLLQTKP